MNGTMKQKDANIILKIFGWLLLALIIYGSLSWAMNNSKEAAPVLDPIQAAFYDGVLAWCITDEEFRYNQLLFQNIAAGKISIDEADALSLEAEEAIPGYCQSAVDVAIEIDLYNNH